MQLVQREVDEIKKQVCHRLVPACAFCRDDALLPNIVELNFSM